jgi:hypothetical protein
MNILTDINTREDVHEFYKEHMQYKRGDIREELKMQKKFKKCEYIHMYKILFGNEPAGHETRQSMLYKMQYYFDSMARAKAI